MGLIDGVPTCKELLSKMEKDAEEILLKSAACVVQTSSKL
jgi:hypothetical protein